MLQMPNLGKIRNVTFLLTALSAILIFAVGLALLSIAKDVKVLNKYMENAVMVQPNFEDSMLFYTTKTEKVFDSLMKLRPSTEEDYVTFISNVERAGKQLSLNMNIRSIREETPGSDKAAEKTISYAISFYGADRDLISLISALQELPYFVRIYEINYRNLDGMSEDEKKEANINLKIALYVK